MAGSRLSCPKMAQVLKLYFLLPPPMMSEEMLFLQASSDKLFFLHLVFPYTAFPVSE